MIKVGKLQVNEKVMIKVGKLQVNEKVDERVYLMFIILSLILLVIFGYWLISTLINTKDYVVVNATITEVNYDITYEDGGNTYNYVKLKYEYENKFYESKQRVAFRLNKKIGNKIKLYVNPDNANEVRNNYNFRISIVLTIFSLIMHIFLIKLYINRKKIKN